MVFYGLDMPLADLIHLVGDEISVLSVDGQLAQGKDLAIPAG